MTFDVRKFLFDGLLTDERYKQVLSGVQDERVQEQVDATVRQFLEQAASGMEALQRSIDDPDTRKRLIELLRGGK